MQITFTIPDVKAQRIIDAIKGLYAVPQIPVDPNDLSLGLKPEFTDAQWAKEYIRRWIVEQVARYESQKAMEAVQVNRDDTIIES